MIPLYSESEFKNAKSKQLLPMSCFNCKKVFFKPKNHIQAFIKWKGINKRLGKYMFCSKSCINKFYIGELKKVICKNCNSHFLKRNSQIKKQKITFVHVHVPQNIIILIN